MRRAARRAPARFQRSPTRLDTRAFLSSKETVDGIRTIVVDHGYAGMQQRPPRYEEIDAATTLRALRITEEDVDPRFGPIIGNTGNSFALVGLRNAELLARLNPDVEAVEDLSKQHDLIGFYPFVVTREAEFDAQARMFGPYYGIPEEAATGMAADPLACLLHRRSVTGELVRIGQGFHMPTPSPSALEVRLKVLNGTIVDVVAGGSSSVLERRTVDYALPSLV